MKSSFPIRNILPLVASAAMLVHSQGLKAAVDPAVYRINCGGDKFADDSGHIWQADAYYTGGQAHAEWNDTYGTENKHLHLSWRYQDSLPMKYTFPALAGNYKVRLHFSEHDTTVFDAGIRVFKILANGKTLIDSLDIYGQAMGITALTKEFIVPSQNGSIALSFVNIKYQAMVSGIEVYPESWKDAPFPSTPPYRLACGGLGFKDSQGNVWLPDGAYGEGGRDSHFTGAIAKTDIPALYLSERWDNSFSTGMSYTFPIPDDRNYVVRMHFAETNQPAAKVGKRVFGILINDSLVMDAVDIFQIAGFATPLILEFNATAVDGRIHVGLQSEADAAKINGIEVYLGTASAAIPIKKEGKADAFSVRSPGQGLISASGRFSGAYRLSLCDGRGKVWGSRNGTGSFDVVFGNLAPGLYLLRAAGATGTVHQSVFLNR